MKWFMNLKIGAKLITSFILVALIAGVIGYVGIASLKSADESDTMLYENMTVPISELAVLSTSYQKIRVAMRDILLSTSEREKIELQNEINKENEAMDKTVASFEKTIVADNIRESFRDFTKKREIYEKYLKEIVSFGVANKPNEALALMRGDAKKSAADLDDAITLLTELKIKTASDLSVQNTVNADSAIRLMIIFLIVGVVIAMSLGTLIARIIGRPIVRLTEAADKLAVGNIDITIESNTKDEVGLLESAFKVMINNIREQVLAAEKIAGGDITAEVKVKSEKDVLSKALNKVTATVKELVAEAKMLTIAAVKGELKTRGNAEKFNGGYKEIVSGVNQTLDAVINPLNVAANYVDQISRGAIP
ncbi:MAG: MCP four helix bundle domain-containing protein, partial [Ignavibacteria bacterium]